MEFTVRDLMVIFGVVLILAVLLDAWRRVSRERKAQVRMKLVDPEELPSEREVDIGLFSELPNGGGRIVDRGDILERVRFGGGSDVGGESSETLISGMTASGPSGEAPDDIDLLEGASTGGESEKASRGSAGRLPRGEVAPEVFMLNVLAREKTGLKGDDILQILLACDLRFGDMSFFHRSEFEAGRGAIQFSVANMMQPGVFDIDNMSDLATPGLVFFLTLPGPEDMMKAFDYMLETAQAVARNLKADVLDESRSVLTQQTIEHSRQQIRELERRQLARAR
jgi:cell division protein ZipA